MDVGVDAWEFRPVSFGEILKRMSAVTEAFSED
jgi:calcineurin-like phosphoesterase family protein